MDVYALGMLLLSMLLLLLLSMLLFLLGWCYRSTMVTGGDPLHQFVSKRVKTQAFTCMRTDAAGALPTTFSCGLAFDARFTPFPARQVNPEEGCV